MSDLTNAELPGSPEEHPLYTLIMERLAEGPPDPGTELPLPHSAFFHMDHPEVEGDFRVAADGNGVEARVVLGKPHEGAVGLVHGGMLTSLVDHLFGQASTMSGMPAVTREITTRFHRPTYLGRPIEIRTRVENTDGRDIFVEGTCTQDGKIVATSHGHFIQVSLDRILAPEQRNSTEQATTD